jgi:hypothetical protein
MQIVRQPDFPGAPMNRTLLHQGQNTWPVKYTNFVKQVARGGK